MSNELKTVEVNEQVPVEFINQDFANELTGVIERNTMFCSFEAVTPEDKKKLFNAMNSSENALGDHIGETIAVKDVFCETVTIVREETGEKIIAPRIVLIDEKGNTFNSTSFGIFNSLKKLMQVFGVPTWHEPVKVKVKQLNRNGNRVYTLEVV